MLPQPRPVGLRTIIALIKKRPMALKIGAIIISLEPFSIFFTIPLVFLLIGLPCALFLIYQTRTEIRLLKFGTITTAEVISMTHNPGLPISKVGQGIQIHYQYKTNRNKTYFGEWFHFRQVNAEYHQAR
jgi:hypothetical protein